MNTAKNYRFLPIISGLFTTVLVISNTLDTKIFSFFTLNLPAGIILFPLGYVFGDILTEVYGYAVSRRVIWTGFFALLLTVASYKLAISLPSASFWGNQGAYSLTLGQVPRLVLASIFAYFAGEFCNSYVVAKLKVKNNGKYMASRFVTSTFVGQAVDTITFVAIAFIGVFDLKQLISLTISGWLVKVAWEIIALPVTLPFVNWLKKAEHEDYYDRETKFTPFSFRND